MYKVLCDICGVEFAIDAKTRDIGDGKEEVYFSCPSCHEIYIAYVQDQEAKELIAQIKQLTEKYKKFVNLGNVQASKKQWNKVLLMQRKLKKHLNSLKEVSKYVPM